MQTAWKKFLSAFEWFGARRHGIRRGLAGLLLPSLVLACAAAMATDDPARKHIDNPFSGLASSPNVDEQMFFVVKDVRPEAFSWFWNNLSQRSLRRANRQSRDFEWIDAPAQPNELGYESRASFKQSIWLDGRRRSVTSRYRSPDSARGRVDPSNYLGDRPFSFLAMTVTIDDGAPIDVLLRYQPVGDTLTDTAFSLELTTAGDTKLAHAYGLWLRRLLEGTGSFLTNRFDRKFYDDVVLTRGSVEVTPIDFSSLTFRVIVNQQIKGITPDMLAWWWDHIDNLARYRLWQPIDHDRFEWEVAPRERDLQYDIGAVQIVREFIGNALITLRIEGVDPEVSPAPVPIEQPRPYFFNSLAEPQGFQQVQGVSLPVDIPLSPAPFPANKLIHQWRWNDAHDGVILDTVFTIFAGVLIPQPSFGEDLGRHALREFQTMPYFLPRLYRSEWLGLTP